MKKTSLKRAISLIVVVCFLTTNATAMPAQTLDGGWRMAEVEKIKNISVPSALGSVIETYTAPRVTGQGPRKDVERDSWNEERKVVIYIQDAHDSLEAQENIAAMIRQFVKEYGVRTVYEEGYEGPVPTDRLFDSVKDPELKEKISYYLMDKLRVGGAEYAHINRNNFVDGGQRMADGDKQALLHPPSSIHPPDFKLIGADSIALHLENIRAYEQSFKNRKDVIRDIQRIRKELQNLIDRDFSKEMKEWLKLKDRYQNGKLPLGEYLQRMYRGWWMADGDKLKTKTPFTILPPLPSIENLLSGNDDELKKIDLTTLIKEIKQMEEEIVQQGLPSERDQKTYGYFQSVLLLEKLNSIQLSEEEYAFLKESLEELRTEDIAGFIARESHRSIVLFRSWEELISDSINFYELAKKRDESIAKCLLLGDRERGFGTRDSSLAKTSPEKQGASPTPAVLVFGGFHKEAIKKILKEKGISYVILSPTIGNPSKRHEDYYRMLMSGGKHSFELLQDGGRRMADGGNRNTILPPPSSIQGNDVARESTCPQRAVTMDYTPIIDRLAGMAAPFRSEVRQDFMLKMDQAVIEETKHEEKRSETRADADSVNEWEQPVVFENGLPKINEKQNGAKEESLFQGHYSEFGPDSSNLEQILAPFPGETARATLTELINNASWFIQAPTSSELQVPIEVQVKKVSLPGGSEIARITITQPNSFSEDWRSLQKMGEKVKADGFSYLWNDGKRDQDRTRSNTGAGFKLVAFLMEEAKVRLEYHRQKAEPHALKTIFDMEITPGRSEMRGSETAAQEGAFRYDLKFFSTYSDFLNFGLHRLTFGTQFLVDAKDGWPFVLKLIRHEPEEGSDSEETENSYLLTEKKLGGLVFDFVFAVMRSGLIGMEISSVIMRKTEGMRDFEQQLREVYFDKGVEAAKALLHEHVELIVKILRRGVMTFDVKFRNFGTQSNALRFLDPGHLSESYDENKIQRLFQELSINEAILKQLDPKLAEAYEGFIKEFGLDAQHIRQTVPRIFGKDPPAKMPDISDEVIRSLPFPGVQKISRVMGERRGAEVLLQDHGNHITVTAAGTENPKRSEIRGKTPWQGDKLSELWPKLMQLLGERKKVADTNLSWEPAIVVFGSARIPRDHPYFQKAADLGKAIWKNGFVPRTGAGPSMMEAVPEGYLAARRASGVAASAENQTQGIKIELPFETSTNDDTEQAKFYDRFITRKLALHENIYGAIAVPGGFGTMDEVFEVWRRGRPLVLLGKDFWEPIVTQLYDSWEKAGLTARVDRRLTKPYITDDVEQAVQYIKTYSDGQVYKTNRYDVPGILKDLRRNLIRLHQMPRGVTFVGRPSERGHEIDIAEKLAYRLVKKTDTPVRIASRNALFDRILKNAQANKWLDSLQAVLFFSPRRPAAFPAERSLGKRLISTGDESNHQFLTTNNSHAFVFLPGGVGTMNKLFDIVQIMQTDKGPRKPILLVGRSFWQPIKDALVRRMAPGDGGIALISPQDPGILRVVDSVEEAWKELNGNVPIRVGSVKNAAAIARDLFRRARVFSKQEITSIEITSEKNQHIAIVRIPDKEVLTLETDNEFGSWVGKQLEKFGAQTPAEMSLKENDGSLLLAFKEVTRSETRDQAHSQAERRTEQVEPIKRDPLSINNADELADYIEELVTRINGLAGEAPKRSLSSIIQNPQKYEKDFYQPLYELLLARISNDFDGAEGFVAYGRGLLATQGVKALREAMDQPDMAASDAWRHFQQIKAGKNTPQASIDFYGQLLSFLTTDLEGYFGYLYDEVIRTRPGIAIARQGVSYHTRAESTIRLGEKGILYGTEDASVRYGQVRDSSFDQTHLDMDGRRNGPHAAKIAKAIAYWKEQAEKLGSEILKDRIADFENSAVVVEFDSDLPLIIADTEQNVIRVLHTERLTHALNFSSAYLESLDINNPQDMKELAVWLNIGQEWLGIYSDIVGPLSGALVNDEVASAVETERMLINTHFFGIEDSGLIPIEAQRERWPAGTTGPTLEERLASRMKKHVLKRYKRFLNFVIEKNEKAEALFAKGLELQALDPQAHGTGAQRYAAREPFASAHVIYRELLNRYEAMGMHESAKKIFRRMVYTTSGVQLYDFGGLMPYHIGMELIFTALRLGLWEDFLNELEIAWTGRPDPERGIRAEILQGALRRGYPRKLTDLNVDESENMLGQEWFSTKLKSAMKSQLLATPPELFGERERYMERANKLLATLPLSALKPEDVDRDSFSDDEGVRSEVRQEQPAKEALNAEEGLSEPELGDAIRKRIEEKFKQKNENLRRTLPDFRLFSYLLEKADLPLTHKIIYLCMGTLFAVSGPFVESSKLVVILAIALALSPLFAVPITVVLGLWMGSILRTALIVLPARGLSKSFTKKSIRIKTLMRWNFVPFAGSFASVLAQLWAILGEQYKGYEGVSFWTIRNLNRVISKQLELGKTKLPENILRELILLSPDLTFQVLDFQHSKNGGWKNKQMKVRRASHDQFGIQRKIVEEWPTLFIGTEEEYEILRQKVLREVEPEILGRISSGQKKKMDNDLEKKIRPQVRKQIERNLSKEVKQKSKRQLETLIDQEIAQRVRAGVQKRIENEVRREIEKLPFYRLDAEAYLQARAAFQKSSSKISSKLEPSSFFRPLFEKRDTPSGQQATIPAARSEIRETDPGANPFGTELAYGSVQYDLVHYSERPWRVANASGKFLSYETWWDAMRSLLHAYQTEFDNKRTNSNAGPILWNLKGGRAEDLLHIAQVRNAKLREKIERIRQDLTQDDRNELTKMAKGFRRSAWLHEEPELRGLLNYAEAVNRMAGEGNEKALELQNALTKLEGRLSQAGDFLELVTAYQNEYFRTRLGNPLADHAQAREKAFLKTLADHPSQDALQLLFFQFVYLSKEKDADAFEWISKVIVSPPAKEDPAQMMFAFDVPLIPPTIERIAPKPILEILIRRLNGNVQNRSEVRTGNEGSSSNGLRAFEKGLSSHASHLRRTAWIKPMHDFMADKIFQRYKEEKEKVSFVWLRNTLVEFFLDTFKEKVIPLFHIKRTLVMLWRQLVEYGSDVVVFVVAYNIFEDYLLAPIFLFLKLPAVAAFVFFGHFEWIVYPAYFVLRRQFIKVFKKQLRPAEKERLKNYIQRNLSMAAGVQGRWKAVRKLLQVHPHLPRLLNDVLLEPPVDTDVSSVTHISIRELYFKCLGRTLRDEGIHSEAAQRGFELVLRGLEDRDPWVRKVCAGAMGKIAHQLNFQDGVRAYEALMKRLREKDEWIVSAAVMRALGSFPCEPALDVLTKALKDSKGDFWIQKYAAESIGKILERLKVDQEVSLSPVIRDAVEVLLTHVDCFRQKSVEVRVAVVTALARLREDMHPEMSFLRPLVNGELIAAFWQDPDPTVREYALWALARHSLAEKDANGERVLAFEEQLVKAIDENFVNVVELSERYLEYLYQIRLKPFPKELKEKIRKALERQRIAKPVILIAVDGLFETGRDRTTLIQSPKVEAFVNRLRKEENLVLYGRNFLLDRNRSAIQPDGGIAVFDDFDTARFADVMEKLRKGHPAHVPWIDFSRGVSASQRTLIPNPEGCLICVGSLSSLQKLAGAIDVRTRQIWKAEPDHLEEIFTHLRKLSDRNALMASELTLVPITDEKGERVIGEKPLVTAHLDGDRHFRSVVLVVTSDGKILRQLKSEKMTSEVGKYDVSARAHIARGETFSNSAKRALKEKLALDVSESDLVPVEMKSYFIRNNPHDMEKVEVFVHFLSPGETPRANDQDVAALDVVPFEELIRDVQIHPALYSRVLQDLSSAPEVLSGIRRTLASHLHRSEVRAENLEEGLQALDEMVAQKLTQNQVVFVPIVGGGGMGTSLLGRIIEKRGLGGMPAEKVAVLEGDPYYVQHPENPMLAAMESLMKDMYRMPGKLSRKTVLEYARFQRTVQQAEAQGKRIVVVTGGFSYWLVQSLQAVSKKNRVTVEMNARDRERLQRQQLKGYIDPAMPILIMNDVLSEVFAEPDYSRDLFIQNNGQYSSPALTRLEQPRSEIRANSNVSDKPAINTRMFDLAVTPALIVLAAPILFVATLLIAVATRLPIFLAQERMGFKRKLFTIYKLRTLGVDGEPIRIGFFPLGKILRKSGIDEFPQLWNIVKGEMALFGPRPLLPRNIFSEEYRREVLDQRLPGLLSLWMAKIGAGKKLGPYSVQKIIEYNRYEMKRWSFFLMAQIAFETVWRMALDLLGVRNPFLEKLFEEMDKKEINDSRTFLTSFHAILSHIRQQLETKITFLKYVLPEADQRSLFAAHEKLSEVGAAITSYFIDSGRRDPQALQAIATSLENGVDALTPLFRIFDHDLEFIQGDGEMPGLQYLVNRWPVLEQNLSQETVPFQIRSEARQEPIQPYVLVDATEGDREGILQLREEDFSREPGLSFSRRFPELYKKDTELFSKELGLAWADADPSQKVIIAKTNGIVTGYVWVKIDQRVAHIQHITVSQAQQRQGIGAALFKRAIEWARRSQKADQITVLDLSQHQQTSKLAERNGFIRHPASGDSEFQNVWLLDFKRSETRGQNHFLGFDNSLEAEVLSLWFKDENPKPEEGRSGAVARYHEKETLGETGKKLRKLYETIDAEIRKYYFKRLEKGIFIPTPLEAIDESLEFVRRIRPGAETFYEFGSGDGRVSLLAASKGWSAEGVEHDQGLVDISNRMAQRAAGEKLIKEGRAKFSQGDAMDKDFSAYDIIFVTDSDGFEHQAFQDKVNREAKDTALIVMNHPKKPLKGLRSFRPWFWEKPGWLGEAEGQVAIYRPKRPKNNPKFLWSGMEGTARTETVKSAEEKAEEAALQEKISQNPVLYDKKGVPYKIEMVPADHGRFAMRVNALQEPEKKGPWTLRPRLERPRLAGFWGWLRLTIDRFRPGEFYGIQYGASTTVGVVLLDRQKNGWHIPVIDFSPAQGKGLYSAAMERLIASLPLEATIHIDDIANPETFNTLYMQGDFFRTPLGKPFAGRMVFGEITWDVFGPRSVILRKVSAFPGKETASAESRLTPADAIVAVDQKLGTVVDFNKLNLSEEAKRDLFFQLNTIEGAAFKDSAFYTEDDFNFTQWMKLFKEWSPAYLLIGHNQRVLGAVGGFRQGLTSWLLDEIFVTDDGVRGKGEFLLRNFTAGLQGMGARSCVIVLDTKKNEGDTAKLFEFYKRVFSKMKEEGTIESFTHTEGRSLRVVFPRSETRAEEQRIELLQVPNFAERSLLEQLSLDEVQKVSDPQKHLVDTARQFLLLQPSEVGYQLFRRYMRDAFRVSPPSFLRILSVAGMSGSGKTTITKALLERHPDQFIRLRRTTTRIPRPEDAALKNHRFLTVEMFQKELQEGLIYAPRFNGGNHYGYSIEDVLDVLLLEDKIAVMESLNAAKELKRAWPQTQLKIIGLLSTEYWGESDVDYKRRVADLIRARLIKRDPSISEKEVMLRLRDSTNVEQLEREALRILINPDGRPFEDLYSEFERVLEIAFPGVLTDPKKQKKTDAEKRLEAYEKKQAEYLQTITTILQRHFSSAEIADLQLEKYTWSLVPVPVEELFRDEPQLNEAFLRYQELKRSPSLEYFPEWDIDFVHTVDSYVALSKETAPPVIVKQTENGTWRAFDGAKRLIATKLRGDTHINGFVGRKSEAVSTQEGEPEIAPQARSEARDVLASEPVGYLVKIATESDDQNRRDEAASLLLKNPENSVGILAKVAVFDKDELVRARASALISKMPISLVKSPLRALVTDVDDPEVRTRAAQWIAQQSPEVRDEMAKMLVPTAIRAMNDTRRKRAAEALLQYIPKEAARHLGSVMLNEKDAAILEKARQILLTMAGTSKQNREIVVYDLVIITVRNRTLFNGTDLPEMIKLALSIDAKYTKSILREFMEYGNMHPSFQKAVKKILRVLDPGFLNEKTEKNQGRGAHSKAEKKAMASLKGRTNDFVFEEDLELDVDTIAPSPEIEEPEVARMENVSRGDFLQSLATFFDGLEVTPLLTQEDESPVETITWSVEMQELKKALMQRFSQGQELSFIDLDTGRGAFIPAFRKFLEEQGYRVAKAAGTEMFRDLVTPGIIHANAQIPEDFNSLEKNSFDIVTINNIESAPWALAERARELLKPGGVLLVTIEENDAMEGRDHTIASAIKNAGFEVTSHPLPLDYPSYETLFKSLRLLIGVVPSGRSEIREIEGVGGAEAMRRVQPVSKVGWSQDLPKKEMPAKETSKKTQAKEEPKDVYTPSAAQPAKNAGTYTPASIRKKAVAVAREQAIRKALENLKSQFTIMADMADVAEFTEKQLEEFEVMAHLQANVKFVFYGDKGPSEVESKKRLEQLQRELGTERVMITEAGSEAFSLNKNDKVIRISKNAQSAMPRTKLKKIFEFRYIADETGLVAMALLYADQHEKPSEKGMMDLSMVSGLLRAELREFQNSVVFARAA